jgi:hypothetical protein
VCARSVQFSPGESDTSVYRVAFPLSPEGDSFHRPDSMNKLDREETELVASHDAEEWHPVEEAQSEMKRYQGYMLGRPSAKTNASISVYRGGIYRKFKSGLL